MRRIMPKKHFGVGISGGIGAGVTLGQQASWFNQISGCGAHRPVATFFAAKGNVTRSRLLIGRYATLSAGLIQAEYDWAHIFYPNCNGGSAFLATTGCGLLKEVVVSRNLGLTLRYSLLPRRIRKNMAADSRYVSFMQLVQGYQSFGFTFRLYRLLAPAHGFTSRRGVLAFATVDSLSHAWRNSETAVDRFQLNTLIRYVENGFKAPQPSTTGEVSYSVTSAIKDDSNVEVVV